MYRIGILTLVTVTSFFSTVQAEENFTDKKKEWGITEFVQTSDLDVRNRVCRIYVCKHGRTDYEKEGRLQGWSKKAKLVKEGEEEMRQLGEKLYVYCVSHIYSSDLVRAAESARALSDAIEVPQATRTPEIVYDAAFREANHAEFQDQLKESYKDHPHHKYYYSLPYEKRVFCPFGPSGESIVDILNRALPKIKAIAKTHSGNSVILLTHGGLIKGLRILAENDFSYMEEHKLGKPSEFLTIDVMVDRDGNISFMSHGVK
jgi:broad specificity phosphatase PhoE